MIKIILAALLIILLKIIKAIFVLLKVLWRVDTVYRDFKSEPVNEASLKKALELAMKSPSACNRQSTRVYVLNHTDFNMIENWTGGAKTFIHMVDKMLIITGQMSAYEKDEYFQYCISAEFSQVI